MSDIKNKTLIANVNQDSSELKLEHVAQYALLLTPYKLLRIHKITPYGFYKKAFITKDNIPAIRNPIIHFNKAN